MDSSGKINDCRKTRGKVFDSKIFFVFCFFFLMKQVGPIRSLRIKWCQHSPGWQVALRHPLEHRHARVSVVSLSLRELWLWFMRLMDDHINRLSVYCIDHIGPNASSLIHLGKKKTKQHLHKNKKEIISHPCYDPLFNLIYYPCVTSYVGSLNECFLGSLQVSIRIQPLYAEWTV